MLTLFYMYGMIPTKENYTVHKIFINCAVFINVNSLAEMSNLESTFKILRGLYHI